MTKRLPDLHRVDELKNFIANNHFRVVFEVAYWDLRKLVSHVLKSRASERGTVTIEQVRLGIGIRVQL